MTRTGEPLGPVSPAERDAHWPLKGLGFGSGSPVSVIRRRLPAKLAGAFLVWLLVLVHDVAWNLP